MKKIIILFFSIFLFAQDLEKVVLQKIKYALNCNAQFSYVSEIELEDTSQISREEHLYKVYGTYKSVLSGSLYFKGFGVGDESHPISGSFVAIVKIKRIDVDLKKIIYKVAFKRGFVKKECLIGG